jgi:hypothetical protein
VEMGFSAEMQKYDQSQGRITIRSQDAMSFKTQLKKNNPQNQNYPLVNKHSYWKWPFIVDFPIKKGDFP